MKSFPELPHASSRYAALLRRSVGVLAILAICLVTWIGVEFDVNRPGALIPTYLVIIVVVSLTDSFAMSVTCSVIAVLCLDYFFVEPRYTFYVESPQDVTALVTFHLSSLAINILGNQGRRLAELTLRQARVLDLTHDAVFSCDNNDVITSWNHGAEQLYGWTRAEAVGRIPQQFLHTRFPAPIEEIKQALAGAGRWEGELVQERRDGSEIHVAARWSLQRDETGQVIGVVRTNNDITERKKAEEALHRSQAAYLAEAQRLSHAGSFGWDVASGEPFWSEETFRIFGFDTNIKPAVDVAMQRIHPDDVDRVREIREQAISNMQAFDFEHRLLMPDGSVKTLHVVAHPITDSGKLQFVGAVMDVTARTEAYAALERGEQRYRGLFQNMPISLWHLDARGLIDLFNEIAAAGVTDFPAYLDEHPEFVARALEVLLIEEVNDFTVKMFGAADHSEFLGPTTRFWQNRQDTIRRALESRFRGETTYEEKTQVNTIDGRLLDVLFTATRTAFGVTLVGLVDLTDLVRAQETLQRLQAEFAHAARVSMLGELTASIAHEINQPLAAIRTNAEAGLRWLDRPEPDLAEVHALTRNIVADAGRAADIIARIRAMAFRGGPEHTLVSLHEVIIESLQFLRHEVQARGVKVYYHLASAPPIVKADRTQLQQVVVNLVVNAMQAMAQNGAADRRITIRTTAPDLASLHCSIEDSGPGISTEHLARLFESFFTTKVGGMGIGLAICRTIVEAHGGRIAADNESRDGGARVFFTLPAANQLHS